jgi:uncharacterized protein involved in copper resistance
MKTNNSMKSIISKTLFAAVVAVTLSLNTEATTINRSPNDTTRKSKMKMDKMGADKMKADKMDKMPADKMEAKKTDKMADKKMPSKVKKDSGKMSKMSKM